MSTATNPIPDVPLPAGAVDCRDWEDTETRPWRTVAFVSRRVTDHQAHIEMCACQYVDGNLDDFEIVIVGADFEKLNSDQAREMAAALLEAAAELDGWTR